MNVDRAAVNWARCSLNGKACYPSKRAAVLHGQSHGGHGHAYRCKHCGHHHYTSQPKNVTRAIRYLLESMK